MASLSVVVYRLDGGHERLSLQEVPLTELVGLVKSKIVSCLSGRVEGDIDIIIGGRELQDEKSLDACSVTPGSTLIAIERRQPTGGQPSGGSSATSSAAASVGSRQVAEALLYLGDSGPYRAILEEVVTDPSTLDSLMESVTELRHDLVAQAVLQEPDMLAVLTDPQQAERLFAVHGCLRVAVVLVAAKVKERAMASGVPLPGMQRSRRMAAASQPPLLPAQAPAAGSSAPVITTSQLSAALAAAAAAASGQQTAAAAAAASGQQTAAAAAAASGQQTAATAAAGVAVSRTPMQQQPASSSSSSRLPAVMQPISQDFFAHALQRVHEQMQGGSSSSGRGGAGSLPASASSTGGGSRGSAEGRGRSARYLESQIRQLRDMGIDDEDLARRALTAADGNIALALELIYGDGAQLD